jgi:hypothetical protein
MKNRRPFILLLIIIILIAITFLLWIIQDIIIKGMTTSSLIMIGAAIILLVFAIYAVRKVYINSKSGFPYKDERTRKIESKAGAVAFYVGIYWLLAIGIAIDAFKLNIPASSVPGLGILGMAVIFGLSYWHFSRKGE